MLRQRSLLCEFARVQSARLEARRRRIYANHEAQLDARRAALEEKQAQEQRHLQQRQEVRGWGGGGGRGGALLGGVGSAGKARGCGRGDTLFGRRSASQTPCGALVWAGQLLRYVY
jgi:hypothetical protein